jgi:hypothetical protein
MDDIGSGTGARHITLVASDAHGHAALMLVESLVHTLIERSVISVVDALDVVATAIDATKEITDEFPSPPAELERSVSLLSAIGQSLTHIEGDTQA